MSYDMRVRAFAKINRSLRVLGVRDGGYHELRTIFQSIALHDTLTVRSVRGPFQLTCDDPACPADGTNLIARAAAAMWTASGRRGSPSGVAIHLRKRIPMQAGLGGGSSDGAAALRVFAKRWRVADAKVADAAEALGADVPYFLEGGAALGLERGDLLFRLAEPEPAWVVLVIPDFGVSTRDAFAWFDQWPATPKLSRFDERRQGNDLEAPVVARHPEIGRIISALRRSGASQAAMSGTGSAVFGLFSARTSAIRAAARMGASGRRISGRQIVVTRTLNHQTYQRLAGT